MMQAIDKSGTEKSSLALGIALILLALLYGAVASLVGPLYAVLLLLLPVGGSAILLDYRIGVWFLVLLLPFAATHLIPRQILGVTGLNPVNALLLVTLVSVVIAYYFGRPRLQLIAMPTPLILYLGLVGFGAVLGSFSAEHAIPRVTSDGSIEIYTKTRYLLEALLKPMIIVVVAGLLAIQARNGSVRSVLMALALAALVFFGITVGHLLVTGASLHVLASSHTRGFLSWTGMHANELGLLANMFFAVLFFAFLKAQGVVQRMAFFLASGASGLMAALTFSRGAFIGILLVGMYFMVSRRRAGQLFIGLLVVALAALFLPHAFVERATTGFARADLNIITAGRLDDIWRPLWPWVWESPFWGHGLGSTWWAPANVRGAMLPVGHPHSAYLGVVLDSGLVGVVITAVFFWSMWVLFRRLMRVHPEPLWQGVFEGGLVCMLILFFQGVTDDRFTPTYSQTALWLIYGLALGHMSAISSRPPE